MIQRQNEPGVPSGPVAAGQPDQRSGTTRAVRPTISYIVPCFNGRAYLEECLSSIKGASDGYCEILVVDDGSTQAIRDVVERFAPLARYLWQPNQGPGAARNHGIRESSGKYLRFVDADDVLLQTPGLSRQVALLDARPEVGLVYGQSMKVDRWGRVFGLRKPPFALEGYVRPGIEELAELFLGNYITTSSVIVRRSVIDQVGPFRTDLRTGQDWELWLRIARASSVAYVAEPLVAYRVHDASVTARKTLAQLQAEADVVRRLMADDIAANSPGLHNAVSQRWTMKFAAVAYQQDQMQVARDYATRLLIQAAKARDWAQARRWLRFLAKTLMPPGLRLVLNSASVRHRALRFMRPRRSRSRLMRRAQCDPGDAGAC